MSVLKFKPSVVTVEQTAPLEIVVTHACEGGKTVQMVYTASMFRLLNSKVGDLPKEVTFGEGE